MARTRLTPFARFLIFLLIFLPLVFFGVTLARGEDPVATARSWVGLEDDSAVGAGAQVQEVPMTETTEEDFPRAEPQAVLDLRAEVAELRRDLAVAREELARCQTEEVE